MTNKRPHLRTRTTGLLYHLEQVGPGGATAGQLARLTGKRPRCVAASLRWLARTKLVRYVADGALWQLTDDSMFKETST